MTKHLTATSEITVQAPTNKVWEALTKPALIKQYMMGAEVETEWKVGGPLVYTGTYQGKRFEEKGVIQKLEPGKLLQATHFSTSSGKPDKPENYALVTWQLAAQGGGTLVKVSQDNLATEQAVEASQKNWTSVLEGLKKVVES
ncbi:MAG: SRPBCC family protein [Polyangiales bacterium]